jgi:ketosteroid isomerase-like protein
MRILILTAMVFLTASAAFGQSAKESKAIENAILEVMTRQAADWNNGSIEGFMSGYWESDELVFVSGDRVTRGWKATLDNYKKSYDTREKMGVLAFTDLNVNVISKDAAVVLGSWSLDRATGEDPKGKFTLVFRKKKDGWRIVHDHTS